MHTPAKCVDVGSILTLTWWKNRGRRVSTMSNKKQNQGGKGGVTGKVQGRIKLRSDRIEAVDCREKRVWVHNGRQYIQLAPLSKESVGLKYGQLVPCTRPPKHPK